MKNMMKEYLGNDYSENSILNFLTYWQKPYKAREINDLDCIYLNGDLNADTLVSFWTPLKWVLQILHPQEKFYKTNRNGGDPFFYLKKLENDIDRYLPRNDDLVQLLYTLASLAETRANVFRLPVRCMNKARYCYFYDEVPATLYNVFEGGKFHHHFKSDEDILNWIIEQDLQVAFIDGKIKKDNLRPLLPNLPLREAIWPKTRKEVQAILEEMIYILYARYRLMSEKRRQVV